MPGELPDLSGRGNSLAVKTAVEPNGSEVATRYCRTEREKVVLVVVKVA